MRKPADQPLVTGKTETPPERHFRLPSIDGAEAAETRRALEHLLADQPALAGARQPPVSSVAAALKLSTRVCRRSAGIGS
jgi:hypothetical protein